LCSSEPNQYGSYHFIASFSMLPLESSEQERADYYARQNANSRNIQGFSNYLLDQTVIQDINTYGNGAVGHGTVWNSTADALVKSNPDRYEIVNTPGYWNGVDYQALNQREGNRET